MINEINKRENEREIERERVSQSWKKEEETKKKEYSTKMTQCKKI